MGEHFVVHGGPALAVPIRAEVSVSLLPGQPWSGPEVGVRGLAAMRAELAGVDGPWAAGLAATEGAGGSITGALPLGAGLGGSAALAAAWLRALGVPEGEALAAAIHRCERVAHGRPSGLDGLAVASERPIWLPQREGEAFDGPLGRAGEATVLAEVALPLVVGVVPRRGTTREAVQMVGEARAREPEQFARWAAETAATAHEAREALAAGELVALGAALDRAHGPLAALDLVSPEQAALVEAARAGGALGAKLSGAGLGGAVVALARDEAAAERLVEALWRAGAAHVFGPGGGR